MYFYKTQERGGTYTPAPTFLWRDCSSIERILQVDRCRCLLRKKEKEVSTHTRRRPSLNRAFLADFLRHLSAFRPATAASQGVGGRSRSRVPPKSACRARARLPDGSLTFRPTHLPGFGDWDSPSVESAASKHLICVFRRRRGPSARCRNDAPGIA